MSSFRQYVSELALGDHLPFSVDDIKPDFDNSVLATVAGFELHTIAELTAGEIWFFEKIVEKNAKLQMELRQLTRKVGKDFTQRLLIDINSIKSQNPFELIFSPTPEIEADPEYKTFMDEYDEVLLRILNLSNIVGSNNAINLQKVTFFLISRFNADWDLPDTLRLRQSQIQPILDLILSEANGGVVPEPSPETEAEDEEVAPVAPKGRTGRKSSTLVKV